MKAHRTDVSSLVFGVLFLGVAGWWLMAQFVDLSIGFGTLGWLVAALLVLVGAVGIVAAIRSNRGSGDEPPSDSV
jgi:hypothetical protein